MALRNNEPSHRPNPLSGYLTTREAATQLGMSYWHFMHLVEAERIPGIRVVDRWLFSPADLETYRRSTRSGEITELARRALSSSDITLTPRQLAICQAIAEGQRPAEIARQQQQSRQAVHAQLTLIREKVQNYLTPTAKPPTRVPRRRASFTSSPPPQLGSAPLME
jgi:excisionase family DNA binding protein